MFDPKTNPRIDEYEVIEELGRGGQSTVYRARHRLMNRDVALKVLSASYAQHAEARRMFRVEIRVSAMLSHPHILRAYDAREFEGLPYLVMELCHGKDLNQVLASSKRLSSEDTISYIRQAALGLAFAHDHAVVHRDVKPSNLFLTNDKAVLVFDWGLARLHSAAPTDLEEATVDESDREVFILEADNTEDSLLHLETIWGPASGAAFETQIRPRRARRNDATLTWADHVVGTPAFMAPEQALSSEVDLRADIYSLGATLYTLLTNRPMFEGDIHQVLNAVASHEMPSIEEHREDVSGGLKNIYRKMVAKKPDDRYQSMAEVIGALDGLGAQSRIFISYRREDSLDATDRMYELLRGHFGAHNIFMDVDTIPPGTDFREHLHSAVAQAGIVLAVIGDHWLTAHARGFWRLRRRLDDSNDFVRIEIEAALKRKIPIVPVLVGKAEAPSARDLPTSLRELAFQQAAELRPGRQYHDQLTALVATIRQHLSAPRNG